MEIKYRYKITKAIDRPIPNGKRDIVISYRVMWYYGNYFWQYEMREYDIVIPTCKHPEKDKINIFQDMHVRDLSNDMIRGLVETEITTDHIQDGVDIVARHRMEPLRKWSTTITKEVEIDEDTGLTKERERSIMNLEEMWYGGTNEDNEL